MKSRRCHTPFTLVEIVAVLIVLAVLTAVAVPKYYDLTASARTKAVDGAIAQGLSLCTLSYAKATLDAGQEPTLDQVMTALGTPIIEGDFTLTFVKNGGNDGITVSASGKAGTPVEGGTGNRNWAMP